MIAKLTNSLDLCKTNKLTPVIQNWITGVILKTDNSILKSASNLNGNLNCSKELEHYAS